MITILLLVLPLYINDLFIYIFKETPLIVWALDPLWFVVYPVCLIPFLYRRGEISLEDMGLASGLRVRDILFGLVLASVLFLLFQLFLTPFFMEQFPQRFHQGYSFPPNEPYRSILIWYSAITAGVHEEIVYRGIVTSKLLQRFRSKAWVLILSCAVFAGIHWGEGLGKLIWTFLWAIPLTLWFLKSRNIWGPVSCHVAYGFVVYYWPK